MGELSSAMSTLEWLNNTISNNDSAHENESSSSRSSTVNGVIDITSEAEEQTDTNVE
ncbi:unnamed protein product, partial [Rotaria sp. Silwood1]